jgi:DNA processing protein
MDKRTFFIALNAVLGITPRHFWKIVNGLPEPARIFSMPESEIVTSGLPGEASRRLSGFEPEAFAEREKKKIRELGGRIIIHGDQDYPPSLMQISDPPPVLYLLGAITKEDRIAFAIVGSRAASTRGRLSAERIAGKLAGMGLTIVSGLAIGVDTWAHKGALLAEGRTIAILGCGLDIPYPRYNNRLRGQIMEHGALVSEFPLGTPPIPMNFPRRNRIISGFAMGTLVVEASERSGSLITARYAMEQGRDVFAVPGNAGMPLSSGVNSLIQKGAKLVQTVADIVEEFPIEVQKYLSIQEKKAETPSPVGNSKENLILGLINRDPVHIDDLTRGTSMTSASIASLLMKMELKGLVRQLPGKLFIR